MGIPAQSRWWVLTLLIVGVLVLISALALDRPDVVWSDGVPECPHCRHQVRPYSHRCAECGAEFDWVVATHDQSPLSSYSLSAQEADWIRDRVQALGLEVAARRAAAATGLTEEAAVSYLGSVGRGDCGWCGGTQRDLDLPATEKLVVCPACFGTGHSVDCGGDRHVGIGRQSAAVALARYRQLLADLERARIPDATKRAEARRLAEVFLASHEGTHEAGEILFWPTIGADLDPAATDTIVTHTRARLDKVLDALRGGD